MIRSRFGLMLAAVALLATCDRAVAQGVVTQWNFNSNPADANTGTGTLTPNVGVGTVTGVGSVTGISTPAFNSGSASSGSTDVSTLTDNSGLQTTTYAAQGTNSGAAGAQYAVSSASQSNLIFRFDQRHSNTSTRFVQVQYTTDGTNYVSTGLANGGIFEANVGGDTWYNNRTVDLSGIAGVNNNSSFGVRVVAVFAPSTTQYAAASTTYAPTGTIRFDAVTLTNAHVWTGGTGTGLDVAANFASGTTPAATGTVLFGTAAGGNTTVSTAAGGTTLDQAVFRADAPAYTVNGTGTLTLSAGLVNNSTATHTFTAPVFFGNQNSIYNAGRITLGGDVQFTNGLVAQGSGTVAINGTVLATSTGTLTVASGSTLLGTGTVNRPITVAPGGAIRGGDPTGSAAQQVGALNVVGNVTLNSSATSNGVFRVQASRNTGTVQTGNVNADSSTLSVTGNLNLNPGTVGNRFTIDVVNGTNSLVDGEAYTIQLAGATAIQLNGVPVGNNVTIDPANYTLTSSSFAFTGVSLFTNATNTALFLSFTAAPVPEPGSVLAIAAGVVGLGGYVRRRTRRTT